MVDATECLQPKVNSVAVEFVQIEVIRNDRDAKWTPAPQPNSNQFFSLNVKRAFFTENMGGIKIVLMNAMNICEKHHLIGEHCIQSLKNRNFCYFPQFY